MAVEAGIILITTILPDSIILDKMLLTILAVEVQTGTAQTEIQPLEMLPTWNTEDAVLPILDL